MVGSVQSGVCCYDVKFIQNPRISTKVKMLLILLATLDPSRHHSINKLSIMMGCGDNCMTTTHKRAVDLGYVKYIPCRESNRIKTGRRHYRFSLEDEFVRCG